MIAIITINLPDGIDDYEDAEEWVEANVPLPDGADVQIEESRAAFIETVTILRQFKVTSDQRMRLVRKIIAAGELKKLAN